MEELVSKQTPKLLPFSSFILTESVSRYPVHVCKSWDGSTRKWIQETLVAWLRTIYTTECLCWLRRKLCDYDVEFKTKPSDNKSDILRTRTILKLQLSLRHSKLKIIKVRLHIDNIYNLISCEQLLLFPRNVGLIAFIFRGTEVCSELYTLAD
jgi:hypothetical protein